MSVTEAVLPQVRRLYDQGRYLTALRAGESLGPLKTWTGPEGRIAASRLAVHLGAPRLSYWHRLKAWREHPDDPEVRYYYAYTIFEYDGPFDAWRFLVSQGDMPEASVDVRSSWYALHAQVLAILRDFERSDEWLARALETAPDSPWVHVSRSSVLQYQDRYAESLAAAEEALRLRPWFRPAVQSKAHLLTLREQDDEAFAFLEEAAGNLECAAIYLQLASIHLEREEYEAVEACVRRFEEFSPLLERSYARGFLSLRSYLAYHAGDYDKAIEFSRQSGDEVDLKLAARMADVERRRRKRVQLPVKFIRQHHHTCGPTTLAILSRYWNRPAEHLEVAERICYNGTSNYHERNWARDNGWAVREFTVTEASTERAIDAGIPFTLTTYDPGSAHLQAVIGYDGRRGGIILRDPSVRSRREVFADVLEKDYGPFGPRGMAIVPSEEQSRLDAIDLPDTDLWNLLHRFDGCLEQHRRDDAVETLRELRTIDADHIITLNAERRLTMYDADYSAGLDVVGRLLAKFPDNDVLKMERLSLLRNMSRRDDRLALLEAECAKPDAHPLYLSQLAHELQPDSREHRRACDLVRRAMRRFPSDPGNYSTLAHLHWDALEFEQGLELYRFAACLDDKNETYADWYFRAAQHCRKTDEALDQLRRREELFGDKSSYPARTLDAALCRLERVKEGLQVIDVAMRRRPDDGDLKLYAANAYLAASTENIPTARKLLDEARDHCPPQRWLRSAAYIASLEGNREESLRLYRELLELQPMSAEYHSAVANILSATQGHEAAVVHLREAVERFPHYQPLLELFISRLREESAETVEPVMRRLLELNPANAWAVRELGFLLIRERRFAEAETYCDLAGKLDPRATAWHHLRGDLFSAQTRLTEAREAYREAIRLSIDDDYAIDELLLCCQTPEERREELAFLRGELVRQVIYGDGLLSYRTHAERVLDPEELLNHLREAHAARPDLWHAWMALALQYSAMQRLSDADATIREACERFPLLPRLWYERSRISRVLDDEDDELYALEQARLINPHWNEVVRGLSDVFVRRDEYDKARALLESAVARDANDGVTRGWLADVLWQQGEKEAALREIEKTVDVIPSYDWAWGKLHEWSEVLKQPELPANSARRLAELRPGDPRAWFVLAKNLTGDDSVEERLAALDRTIELAPRSVEARGWKARILAEAGRFDEALAVCATPIFGDQIPPGLLARAAWIRRQQGHHQQAVEELREALRRDPSMYGSWQLLADWHNDAGDHAAYLEAAREMLRLDPFGETTLAYLGEALLRTGDRAGAKEAFARAFDLVPAYEFVGNFLFDLHFEDQENDLARETLARLRKHSESPFVLGRAIQLAAREKQLEEAQSLLRRVGLETPPGMSWPLQAAFEAFDANGWHAQLASTCESLIDAEECHPEVGDLFIRAEAARGNLEAGGRALDWLDKPVGVPALRTWIRLTVGDGQVFRYRQFLDKHAFKLRRHTEAWGYVNWGWTLLRTWPEALPWAVDWQSHPDAEPWMLVNIAEVFRANGRDAEAVEVSRHALSLPPAHGQDLHRLWMAVDEMTLGRYEASRDMLQSVQLESLDDDYRFLFELLDSCLVIALGESANKSVLFEPLRRKIAALADAYPNMKTEPARRAFYRFTLKHLARHAGGSWPLLWSKWRLVKSYF